MQGSGDDDHSGAHAPPRGVRAAEVSGTTARPRRWRGPGLELLSAHPAPGFACDALGRFVYVNAAFEAHTGLRSADVVGRRPRDVCSPDVASALEAAALKASSGSAFSVSIALPGADAADRSVLMTWAPSNAGARRTSIALCLELPALAAEPDDGARDALPLHDGGVAGTGAGGATNLNEEPPDDGRAWLVDRKALVSALLEAEAVDEHGTVVALNVDDFGSINERLGHHGGDEILDIVAQRLREAARTGDLVARVGGNEYAVYLRGTAQTSATTFVARVRAHLAQPFELHAHPAADASTVEGLTVCVGLASSPTSRERSALVYAEVALREAKSRGPGSTGEFSASLHAAVSRRERLTTDLERAIEDGQMRIAYQPVIALGDRRWIGTEALLRWNHPALGPISPAEFIPLAEGNGTIISIGEWVLDRAVHDAAAWQRVPALTGVGVAVNVSARQLELPGLADAVTRSLATSGLPASLLTLELTETALASNLHELLPILAQLRASGAGLAIDDFGTGYSSLSYLQHIPATQIKIDRSLTSELTTDPAAVSIVDSLSQLAVTLGLDVIAEGIETEAEHRALVGLGVGLGQGWLFARATPAEDLAQLAAGVGPTHAQIASTSERPGAANAPARVSSSMTATYTLDLDRRITSWDDAARRLTGYEAEDAIGRHCRAGLLMHTDENGRVMCGEHCPMGAVMADGEPRTATVYFLHADGHRVPSVVHGEALRDPHGVIIGAVETFIDTTGPRPFSLFDPVVSHDPATGLPDREAIVGAIAERLADDEAGNLGIIRISVVRPVRTGGDAEISNALALATTTTLIRLAHAGDVVGRISRTEFLVLTTADSLHALERRAQAMRRLVSTTTPNHSSGLVHTLADVTAHLVAPGTTVTEVSELSGLASLRDGTGQMTLRPAHRPLRDVSST